MKGLQIWLWLILLFQYVCGMLLLLAKGKKKISIFSTVIPNKINVLWEVPTNSTLTEAEGVIRRVQYKKLLMHLNDFLWNMIHWTVDKSRNRRLLIPFIVSLQIPPVVIFKSPWTANRDKKCNSTLVTAVIFVVQQTATCDLKSKIFRAVCCGLFSD